MKPNKLMLCLGIVTVLSACGNANQSASSQPQQGTTEASANFSESSISHASNLVAEANTKLLVSSSDSVEEAAGKEIEIPEGTDLTVLETKLNENKEIMVHIGLDVDDESNLPSDIWVKASDLPAGVLNYTEEGDYEGDSDNEPNIEEGNDELTTALDAVAAKKKVKKGKKKKMTYCYRYVKQYLLKTGKVKVYLPGGSAWQAARVLPKHGFRKTGHTPANAANGEVCVYRGGNGGNGHIEVKIKGKWWYGYGYKSQPITRRNHPFIGCYAK